MHQLWSNERRTVPMHRIRHLLLTLLPLAPTAAVSQTTLNSISQMPLHCQCDIRCHKGVGSWSRRPAWMIDRQKEPALRRMGCVRRRERFDIRSASDEAANRVSETTVAARITG